ncbi:MAG: hypothetical protein AAGI38_02790 [Bacteroidota bacterium]
MKREFYISQLIEDGQLKAALLELQAGLKDTFHAGTMVVLLGRYRVLEKEFTAGTISDEEKEVRIDEIQQGAMDMLDKLGEKFPDKANEEVEAVEPAPDPVTMGGA